MKRLCTGLCLMSMVLPAGCARSDCVRANDAIGAASDRLVAESPAVLPGDGTAEVARKLDKMAQILDEEQRRIGAMEFEDEVVGAAMRDFAAGLGRVIETVRETADATETIATSAKSLKAANRRFGERLDALKAACQAADPPCSLGKTGASSGDETMLEALAKQVEAIDTQDPEAIRARNAVIAEMRTMEKLLASTAEATAVVAGIGDQLRDLDAMTADVSTRLRAQCE